MAELCNFSDLSYTKFFNFMCLNLKFLDTQTTKKLIVLLFFNIYINIAINICQKITKYFDSLLLLVIFKE